MTYSTLMVHLELGRANTTLLQVAGDLAQCMAASAIGIATCQPMSIVYSDGYVAADVIDLDRAELEQEINDAEAEFRAALQSRAGTLEWRSLITYEPLSDFLVREARNADLIVTGVDRGRPVFDTSRRINTGDLVMQAGRPVLVVPAGVNRLKLDRVMIGWKDTREARRAAYDALPLLKQATQVCVVEIAGDQGMATARVHLRDVAGWLHRHGVTAETIASPSVGDDASRLDAIAEEQGADLIVAGAYGHSRLREWVLGGVTRDLLLHESRCALVSH